MEGEPKHFGRVVASPIVTGVSGSQGSVGLLGQTPGPGVAQPELGLNIGMLFLPAEEVNAMFREKLVRNWFKLAETSRKDKPISSYFMFLPMYAS